MFKFKRSITSLLAYCNENNTDGVERTLGAATKRQRMLLLTTRLYRGNTVLHSVTGQGHFGIVKKALSCLDVDSRYKVASQKNGDGRTILHQAVLSGCMATIRSVLDSLSPEQKRKLIASKDINGKSALNYAVRAKRRNVSALLRSYTNQQISSTLKRRRGNTNTSLERVKLLRRELKRETATLSESLAQMKELLEASAEQERLLAATKARNQQLDQEIAKSTQELEMLRKLCAPVKVKCNRVEATDQVVDHIQCPQVYC